MENLAVIIAVVTAITSAVTYIISKIISRVAHEGKQDSEIQAIMDHREDCISEREKLVEKLENRIASLEAKSNDNDLSILSIKEKMEALTQGHETTQTMILTLQDQFKDTTKQLIETIAKLGVK